MAEPVTSSSRYRWVILGVIWLAFIVVFMQRLSIGPLAPFLQKDLGLTSAQVGFFMSAAAAGYGVMTIPAGWLVDRIGVRWLLLIGELIGGVFLISMFTVKSLGAGLTFMALAGMGMGCLMPSTTKAVLVWFPVNERATAMGFKQTAVNVGGIITAVTLPSVAIALSWHYGFLGIGTIAVVIGIASFILYKEPPQNPRLEVSQATASSGPKSSVSEVFKSRDIWLIIVSCMALIIVEFSAIAYFVLYLTDVLLIAVVTAGFFLAVSEVGGALGKPINGIISDRLFHGSRKKVYFLLAAITFVMCMIFSLLPQGSPSWIIIPLSLIFGFTGIGWGGLNLTLMAEFAGRELAGTVTGMSSALAMLAVVAGPPAFGYIVDHTGSYQIAWRFLAVIAIIAATSILFVREERRRI